MESSSSPPIQKGSAQAPWVLSALISLSTLKVFILIQIYFSPNVDICSMHFLIPLAISATFSWALTMRNPQMPSFLFFFCGVFKSESYLFINPLNCLCFSKWKFSGVENISRSLPLLQGPKNHAGLFTINSCQNLMHADTQKALRIWMSETAIHSDSFSFQILWKCVEHESFFPLKKLEEKNKKWKLRRYFEVK